MSHYCRWEKTLIVGIERCINRGHPRGTPSTRDVPAKVYVVPDPLPANGEGALEAKEVGIAHALMGTPNDYAVRFHAAFSQLADSGVSFTSEDITNRVGLPLNVDGSVNEGRVGALVNAAVRGSRGSVRRSGFKPGRRVSAHARMISVWESNQ